MIKECVVIVWAHQRHLILLVWKTLTKRQSYFWSVAACTSWIAEDTVWLIQVFEGVRNKKNGERIVSRELTKEQKRRRVVLKRVNQDNTVSRSDFLRAGTMASVSHPPLCDSFHDAKSWWQAFIIQQQGTTGLPLLCSFIAPLIPFQLWICWNQSPQISKNIAVLYKFWYKL